MAEITVSSFQIPDLQFAGVETGELRLYASREFLDSDGEVHLGGAEGNQEGFYQACPFTVTDGIITVDSFVTTSTLDAQDNAPSTILISGDLFGADGQFLQTLFSKWQIPTTTPTTFATLYNLNRSVYLPIAPDAYLTRAAVLDLIDTALGDRDYASDVVAGITYLSDAPDSAILPIAEGSNSTRLMSSLTYAALTALTAITGVIKFCSDRLKGLYYKTSAAIWCSLTGRANVLDHGCVGDGSTDCRSALNTLCNTTLATIGGVVYLPHYQNAANTDYLIGSDVTIPTNITLELALGARLKIATGVTVTCLAYIPLSPFQIFNLVGTGVVSFAGNRRVRELGGKWWGAVGDGSTDDTTPIKQAVVAASSMGGGKISFPNGIYIIDGTATGTVGHKSRIPMPTIAFAGNELQEIWIDGPSLPPAVFGTVVTTNQPSTKACIFKTTVNTDAVFGGSNGTDFTAVGLKMTNCIVRLPDNPSVIAVDGRLLGGLFLDWFGSDTGRYTTSIVQPTDTNQAAIITPQNGNNADQWLGHVFATGSYYGISVNEHTSGDYIIVAGNATGLGFQTADHASYFKRVLCFNNTENLRFNNTHYTKIEQLDIEHAVTGGGVPVWQGTTYDVSDVGNVGRGELEVQLVVAGTGVPTNWAAEFKTLGASGIKERRVGYPDYICRVSLTAPQTLTTAVEAAISFTTEGEDPYELHSTSVNPSRITVTRTDTYQIAWTVDFAANATGNRTVNFGLNGVTTIPGANFVPVTGIASRSAGCVYYPLAAGDYVDMRVLQTSGGDLAVTQAFFTLQRQ